MRKIFLLAPMLLAACAEPKIVFKPVTVEIPVIKPCPVTAPAKPVSGLSQLSPQATLFDKTRSILIELDQDKTYASELEAALQACQ